MKKTIFLITITLLLPTAAFSSRGGGGHGGGGGLSDGGHGASLGSGGGWGGSHDGGFGGGNRGFTSPNWRGSQSYYGRSYHGNGGYRNGWNRPFNRAYGSRYGFNRNFRGYSFNGNRSMGFHSFNRSANGGNFSSGQNSFSGRFHGSAIPGNLQRSSARMPSRGPDGQRLTGSAFSPRQMNSGFVRNQMSSITGNRNFRSQVNGFNRLAENNRNHYYWHNYGGWNYCNYCDGFGCNWYGWYCGGGFFWTQYYDGLFWWNDPWYGCWDYWDNGCWNWPDPVTNTVYIYENGQYQPSNGDTGNQPPGDGNGPRAYGGNGPSGDGPRNDGAGMVLFQSDDNSRTVKLVGDARDAFLVEPGAKRGKPVFLDTGVQGVRFTGSGRGLRVQLTLRDGSVETFKSNGEPVKGPAAG